MRQCRAISTPDLVAAVAHALGALVGWQVGSLAEAVAAERAGCDFLVAQGESVSNVISVQPAASIVTELVTGAARLLRQAGQAAP